MKWITPASTKCSDIDEILSFIIKGIGLNVGNEIVFIKYETHKKIWRQSIK